MIEIQRESQCTDIPKSADLKRWVKLALQGKTAELTLRIVDEAEIQALNKQFRHKDKPTNVLSFPMDETYLGDIALCAPVILQEALDQHKTPTAHWAHMVIHGVLHLQGYDHISDNQAEVMEALEIKLLAELGFESPY